VKRLRCVGCGEVLRLELDGERAPDELVERYAAEGGCPYCGSDMVAEEVEGED